MTLKANPCDVIPRETWMPIAPIFAFAEAARLLVVKAAPDTGQSGDPASADAIDSAEPDQGFFHHAHEVDGAQAAAAGVLRLRRSKMG